MGVPLQHMKHWQRQASPPSISRASSYQLGQLICIRCFKFKLLPIRSCQVICLGVKFQSASNGQGCDNLKEKRFKGLVFLPSLHLKVLCLTKQPEGSRSYTPELLPMPPLAVSYLWGGHKCMSLWVGIIATCEIPVVRRNYCVFLSFLYVLPVKEGNACQIQREYCF